MTVHTRPFSETFGYSTNIQTDVTLTPQIIRIPLLKCLHEQESNTTRTSHILFTR